MKKILLLFLALNGLNTLAMEPEHKILPMGMGIMQMSFSAFSNEERVKRITTTVRLLLKYAQQRNNNEKIIVNTALIYGMTKGDNELLLAQALKKLKAAERKQLIVVTWVGLDGIAIETEKTNHELVGPESMYTKEGAYTQFINGSFKNLKMEAFKEIEFWVGLHRVNPHTPIAEQAEQLTMIANHPQVAKVGLSEASIPMLDQFIQQNVKVGFLETELSLSRQFAIRDGILNYCKQNNIIMIAYSPLDRGIWTPKVDYLADWITIGKTHPFLTQLSGWNNEQIVRHNYKERSKAVEIAHKYEININQLALAWIMKHGVIPIPDSTDPELCASNFKALDVINKLNSQDMAILNSIKFKGKRYK